MLKTRQQTISVSNKNCSKTFEMFGDRWTLRIVDTLRNGELRFREIESALEINSATLTSRLKKLELLKLVTRNEETIDKCSVTYCLTKQGKELLPIYDGIVKFGEKLVK